MRNFHRVRFPASDSASTLVFRQVPLDVGLNIFKYCSPFDLAQLSRTSRFLRSFVQKNHHLWKLSFQNISCGTCPPLPAPPVVEARWNYSPLAYALWIFGGGPCTCCSTWTDSLPCHFLFRLRACSAACRGELVNGNFLLCDRRRKCTNSPWAQWLPRQAYYTLASFGVLYRYSSQAVEDAESERNQATAVNQGSSWRDPKGLPIRTVQQLDAECVLRARDRPYISRNAEELGTWYMAYVEEKAAMQRANLLMFKGICAAENKKVQGVLRCPAAASVFKAFNRDLEPITTTVWAQIRDLTLSQLSFMQGGIFPPGMTPRRNDKVRCEHCHQLMRNGALCDHVRDKHKERAAAVIPGVLKPTLPRDTLCLDCPNSSRLFSEHGLQDHRLSKHMYKRRSSSPEHSNKAPAVRQLTVQPSTAAHRDTLQFPPT